MERTLASYLAHAPVFVRTLDGQIVYWTSGARRLYGFSWNEAVGHCSHDLLATGFPEPLEQINDRLMKDGEWQGRLRQVRRDGSEVWVESVWRLRLADDGDSPLDVPAVVEMSTDITPTVVAERQREVLAAELSHRVKNTLSVVLALARMTLGAVAPAEVATFTDRLIALSRAHDRLLHHHWEYADLRELLEGTFAALSVDDRVRLEGPDVRVGPGQAQAYSLAFHELATNAIKHGALSAPDGRVEVSWSPAQGCPDRVRLTWRESGGPPVAPPVRFGFGARLVRNLVARELGTSVDLRFEPAGLVCEFGAPLPAAPGLQPAEPA